MEIGDVEGTNLAWPMALDTMSMEDRRDISSVGQLGRWRIELSLGKGDQASDRARLCDLG